MRSTIIKDKALAEPDSLDSLTDEQLRQEYLEGFLVPEAQAEVLRNIQHLYGPALRAQIRSEIHSTCEADAEYNEDDLSWVEAENARVVEEAKARLAAGNIGA